MSHSCDRDIGMSGSHCMKRLPVVVRAFDFLPNISGEEAD